ncbi:acetylglutamate kinase [Paenisporosarcina sp. OV554]|uniref:acetylglutamate kinase n=1 Tax=Paenisporosarcina sp. OV554 TaxID=2135694 RepID=UPI000D3AC1FE|nr:acetylglutamate kinase [Paenisporosarcina sp. OV554]PUB08468.1 hypothetical protein C8K15_1312 [Paenisporosarcina sp. OV554]
MYYVYPTGIYYTPCISRAELELRNTMRLLWEQHVYWTRIVITSLINDSADLDAVLTRLLRNAPDMGNALKPFYGEQLGDQYSALIKDHLVIAADLVKAAKAGDMQSFESIDKKWHANADDIVNFLSSINPYISQQDMREMFYEHLDLTKKETVFLLQKDYPSSINTFDEIERQALEMADEISLAIIKQYPQIQYQM